MTQGAFQRPASRSLAVDTMNISRSLSTLQGALKRVDWQITQAFAGLVALAGLVVWIILSQAFTGWAGNRQTQDRVAFEEQTGIRVIRLALTAGGGMLDLQYQVIDPGKALVVHDEDDPPQLIAASTGEVLATPFHSHTARKVQVGLTYHQVILNSGGLLERGSKVILKVGGAVLEGLIVE